MSGFGCRDHMGEGNTHMARITVLGGTGYGGSAVVREAARRGHEVLAVSRTAPSRSDARRHLPDRFGAGRRRARARCRRRRRRVRGPLPPRRHGRQGRGRLRRAASPSPVSTGPARRPRRRVVAARLRRRAAAPRRVADAPRGSPRSRPGHPQARHPAAVPRGPGLVLHQPRRRVRCLGAQHRDRAVPDQRRRPPARPRRHLRDLGRRPRPGRPRRDRPPRPISGAASTSPTERASHRVQLGLERPGWRQAAPAP